MKYKLMKRLKWLTKHFGKEYNDPRVILIALDREPNAEERTPIQTHHNMCCRAHYVLTLVELLKSEVKEIREQAPDAAVELEEMLNGLATERTLH